MDMPLSPSIIALISLYWQYNSSVEMIAEYDPLYNMIDRPQPPTPAKLVAYPGIFSSFFGSYKVPNLEH